jgi:hypothetical protein
MNHFNFDNIVFANNNLRLSLSFDVTGDPHVPRRLKICYKGRPRAIYYDPSARAKRIWCSTLKTALTDLGIPLFPIFIRMQPLILNIAIVSNLSLFLRYPHPFGL